jgi:hypothetical protein
MLSDLSLTRVVATEALEKFLPGKDPLLGLLGFGAGSTVVVVDVVRETGDAAPGSKELGSDDDSRLRPGMTRPVVNCDWSRSLM